MSPSFDRELNPWTEWRQARFVGSDIDGACIRAAKENFAHLQPSSMIELLQSDFYDIREKVKQFEKIVLVSNVLMFAYCQLASLWIQSKSRERVHIEIIPNFVRVGFVASKREHLASSISISSKIYF